MKKTITLLALVYSLLNGTEIKSDMELSFSVIKLGVSKDVSMLTSKIVAMPFNKEAYYKITI